MDWFYIFAGAHIGLLGTFLFASDRELKAKVRELDTLSGKEAENSAVAEWMARNKELAEQVSHLLSRLEESRGTVDELKNEQQRFVDAQSENQNLQSQNQQLQQQIVNLRNELQTTQSLLSTSASQYEEVLKRDSQLQSELTDSRQQVDKLVVENKARLEEIDSLSHKLVASQRTVEEVNAMQQGTTSENQRLHAANQQLEQETIEKLDATRRRLGEAEDLCRELREDNRRLEEEVLSWQECRREPDEIQRRASATPQQPKEVPTNQTLFDSKLQLINGPTERKSNGNLSYALPNGTRTVQVTQQPTESLVSVKEEIQPNRKWRFGVIPATGAIAFAGFVAVRYMGTSSDEFRWSKEPAAAPQTGSDQHWRRNGAVSDSIKRTRVTASDSDKNESAAKLLRLQGRFRITRPIQVYRRPSESSALIASVGPGMKINVVDSREGWLEIRSKHGRPPGFVRQDAAVKD
jgi:hypothetical protein